MKELELLRKLCLLDAPSGREHWIYEYIEEVFKDFGEVNIENLNNIYIHKKGKENGKIALMAHTDEVFLMITGILNNGFLEFNAVGIDAKTLVGQEVAIHGRKVISGIIAIKSSNIIKEEEQKKAVSADELIIDTGYGDEQLRDIINIGDYVTLKRKFYELLNDNVTCKAIDDRAGIVAMYICARELQNIKHDLDVYFVCSSQEEVGHRGAKMAAYDINPDIGIAIDVTFDGGVLGDGDRENTLGQGPVICVGPNIHPKIREKIMAIADECNISYGVEVEPGNTGSDAWDIQVAREGIPTLLISIPIRYMHTSVEVINMNDIENTGILIAKFIESLKLEELEELLCF